MSFLGVLAAVAWAYVSFWTLRPEGSGAAGPAVAREAFQGPWTGRPVMLVGLGDSVTAGFGARLGYSHFDRLVANPPDEFADLRGICLSAVFPRFQVTNLSLSGSTSSQHVERSCPACPWPIPQCSAWWSSPPAATTS